VEKVTGMNGSGVEHGVQQSLVVSSDRSIHAAVGHSNAGPRV
jgi:hypothetical protein